jgi:trk system potassium uptake protein TrkH
LLFEAASALATDGLSTGITPALTNAGKVVLCVTMFVGRIGPLTAVFALQQGQRPARYRYPTEPVRIG